MKDNPVFRNGSKSLPRNCPDCPILCNSVFDNFVLADKPFAKPLRSFETCVFANRTLFQQLFSSLESPTTSDESFKVTLVMCFIPDFTLLSCELDNFTFKVLY